MEGKYKMILIAILLGTFMTALDATIVSVALPSMTESFSDSGSGTDMISWVLLIYTLMLCCFIMLWSKLGSNYGYKKVFMIGIVIFTVSSLLIGICGLNKNSSLMPVIVLRAVQGIGAGMSVATSLAMVSSYLPEEIRGTAIGAVTLAASAGTAFGPALGGVLTTFGWAYIFFINVPIGIICLFMCWKYMQGVTEPTEKAKVDYIGAALMFVFMFALIFYLNRATEIGWFSDKALCLLVTTFVGAGLFFWWEGRTSDPLLSMRLIKDSNILRSNLVQLLLFGAMAGSYLLLPYYLGGVKGYSTTEYGLILIANSVGMMLTGPLVGKLSDKSGTNKIFMIVGILVAALGFIMFMRMEKGTDLVYIIASLIIMGAGMGMASVAATNLAFQYILPGEDGQISGLTNTFRQAGSSAGVAIIEAVFTATAASATVIGAGTAGYKQAFFLALIIALIAFVVAMGCKDKPKDSGSA